MIKLLDQHASTFADSLSQLCEMPSETSVDVRKVVQDILDDVRDRGDDAVLALTNRFDQADYKDVRELEITKDVMSRAVQQVAPLVIDALRTSIERVEKYHLQQKEHLGATASWEYQDEEGNQLGQIVRAMERVGVYVPGGKASYPSSVVMTVIPAKIAGVKEINLVVPAPGGEISQILLASAHLCGVDRMFTIGGAQAIAAMAYGTDLIPRVDKIVGPGNIFVATAKAMVYGQVDIDMIAGPSEVVIVADRSADPAWLVMDMFAQAEHDELAQAILISTDQALLEDVSQQISNLLPQMSRSEIISKSLSDRGALIRVYSDADATELVNRIAPEHLEIAVADPEKILSGIQHAGAIFIGNHSAEVIGDYSAGPSHVLPTGGTARFASPLGVYDFQVRSSVVQCSARGAVNLSRAAATLAEEEGLEAHSKSASYRVQG